jgi:hypothetical protein
MSTPSSIAGVPIKNSLKSSIKLAGFIGSIAQEISSLPEIQSHRGSLELISLVCNIVEDRFSKSSGKVDKSQVATAILQKLFPDLTPEEVQAIENHCEFLCQNGLVSAIPLSQKIQSWVADWVKKKVL